MDVTVRPASDNKTWHLTDLLGRSMGLIEEAEEGVFHLHPKNRAVETMDALLKGPYKSLDDALRAIETHTRGVCRLAPEKRP